VSPLTGLDALPNMYPALPPPQHAQRRRMLRTPVPRWATLCRPIGL